MKNYKNITSLNNHKHNISSLPSWAQELISQLMSRIDELEAQIAKNSSNSSKPPSSNGFKRPPKSERGRSGKKPGAQKGHVGKTLEQVQKPDHIITHSPRSCASCGHILKNEEGTSIEKRQVFDLPEPKVEVTEHRIEVKKCPCCGETSKGVFPESVTAHTQYGKRIQALSAYFSHQHFLPFDRLSQMFKDIFRIDISPGTCANIDYRLFKRLKTFENSLKEHLINSQVLHFDETGMRCNKRMYWTHVASSEKATFFGMHIKRGRDAINAFNILSKFKGIAIHDHWFPYFSYKHIQHGLCNAHHLRELTFVYEHEKEAWAKDMKEFLLKAKKTVEEHIGEGNKKTLPKEQLKILIEEYEGIILKGVLYHSHLPLLSQGKKGKKRQRPGKNLLDRLADYQECVLRFINDFSVPFTNNQGEQDIRMAKLKQKISGGFRKFSGGEIFCRIRSYISTARKQGWEIWEALAQAIQGQPKLLPP